MRNHIIDSVVLLIVLSGMVAGTFLPGDLTFYFCTIVVWSFLGLRIAFRLQNKFDYSTCLQYSMMFGLLGAFIAQAVHPVISGGNWLDSYPFFIMIFAAFLGFGLGLFFKKKYPPKTFEKIALAAGIFATVITFIVIFSR
ncbi:hypothetical protein [uncultured Gimesia sp.]|uniref:hypothetical protein n=1 Tax=uncultured Gimesia sp. TaxID=1678688 RepID=UPI0030D7E5B2